MPRDWIAEYSQSHQHPLNRACHTVGIPMIAVSILFAIAGVFVAPPISTRLWILAASLFVAGWIFQFIGHAFEHKPPEFLRDPRFLLVGLRWWFAKLRGRA
jgi:uncharacterized membrane protein YGL010W